MTELTEPKVDDGLTDQARELALDTIEGKNDQPFLMMVTDDEGMLTVVSRMMTNGMAKEMMAVLFNRLEKMEEINEAAK